MSAPIAPFRERYRKALGDRLLARNLLNFQRAYGAARRAAFEHFRCREEFGVADPSFASQRERLTSAKRLAIRDRAAHFENFRKRLEREIEAHKPFPQRNIFDAKGIQCKVERVTCHVTTVALVRQGPAGDGHACCSHQYFSTRLLETSSRNSFEPR